MDKALSKRIQEFCSRIAVEQDRSKFLKLCEELNRLLSPEIENRNQSISLGDRALVNIRGFVAVLAS
jgi:hypothetical protein